LLAEVEALMACHDTATFLGVRDPAIAALVLATGLRVTAAAELPLAHYDPVEGVIDTVDKRRRRLAHVNATGKRAIRDWLRGAARGRRSHTRAVDDGLGKPGHGLAVLGRGCTGDSVCEASRVCADLAQQFRCLLKSAASVPENRLVQKVPLVLARSSGISWR
jgi:hypothetical protein